MIRRSVKVQLVAFAAITLLAVSFLSARYVGLGQRLFGGGYVVTADFADSGGIFSGAEVTYRGVQVGRVDHLRLTPGGVLVDLRLNDGTHVPTDAGRGRRRPVGGGGAVRRPAAASAAPAPTCGPAAGSRAPTPRSRCRSRPCSRTSTPRSTRSTGNSW